jgi:hypothetical protein
MSPICAAKGRVRSAASDAAPAHRPAPAARAGLRRARCTAAVGLWGRPCSCRERGDFGAGVVAAKHGSEWSPLRFAQWFTGGWISPRSRQSIGVGTDQGMLGPRRSDFDAAEHGRRQERRSAVTVVRGDQQNAAQGRIPTSAVTVLETAAAASATGAFTTNA